MTKYPENPNYSVSTDGKIYSHLSNKFLKPATSNGYLIVSLTKNGKAKMHSVHRILAETFIPNPQLKAQVNHIDGNKLNNSLDNLEWATQKENFRHYMDVLGYKYLSKAKKKYGVQLSLF